MTNLLPSFIQLRVIDTKAARSLPSLMRWICLIASMAFFMAAPAIAQTTNQTVPKKPSAQAHMAPSTAEPENAQGYAPPAPPERAGPSEADRGPAQKHFILASDTDDLASQDDAETANTPSHETIALDKHIRIPKIHDVQNDSSYKAANNHAFQGEIDYLNWGAVTQEQQQARRGHYFTITWSNGGPSGDFVARFQYRQVNSKAIVRTLTQKMPHISGATRSYFAVVDKAYLAYGPVSSWRFTILKGDTVVAEAKSFIW